MKVYGYCRVSTKQQNIDRQIRNIKEKYPDAVIVTDEYTGTKLDRPGWTKLYKQLKSGDTVVFDQVSRMSRDAEEGFEVYEELFNKGVNLIFIKEPHINTSVYREAGEKQIEVSLQSGSEPIDRFGNGMIKLVNELLLDLAKEQIKLAFEQAEKEVKDLRVRTSEGILAKKIHNDELIREYGEERAKTMPDFTHFREVKGAKLTTKKSLKAKELIRKHSRDFEGTLSDVDVMKLIGCARGSYYKWKRELKAKDDAEKKLAPAYYASKHQKNENSKTIEVELERLPSEDTVIKSGVLVDYHYEE